MVLTSIFHKSVFGLKHVKCWICEVGIFFASILLNNYRKINAKLLIPKFRKIMPKLSSAPTVPDKNRGRSLMELMPW